jgi:hypothetical protein
VGTRAQQAHRLVRCAQKDLPSDRGVARQRAGGGGGTCTERLELPQPREWSSWLGLRFVEHVFVGHYYGLRVRIVDPYINMARLGSMQRDGHSPLLAPFVLYD